MPASKGSRKDPKASRAAGSGNPNSAAAGSGGFAVPPAAKPALRASRLRQQAIPDAVANRMARRIVIATGIPTMLGMGVFIASYLVVSRGIADIPPGLTLVSSGGCFLLGLVGLSYGVLSSSWEDGAGSLLGLEQIQLNLSRLRESVRAMRQRPADSNDPEQP